MSFKTKPILTITFFVTAFLCVTKSYSQGELISDTTWEVYKYERYQKKLKYGMDSLKMVFKHRWSIGFSLGGIFMPGYTAAEKDYSTGINMREKQSYYSLSFEYYTGSLTRIGLEIGWQTLPQKINSDPNGTSIKGGGGMNIPVFLYLKRDIIGEIRKKPALRLTNGKAINQPSLFVVAGAGYTLSNLIKFVANRSSVKVSLYDQTPFTSKLGIGLFQPVGRMIGTELIFTYQISSSYSPHIGGVSSFSGFNLSTRLSVIGNRKFGKMKRIIDCTY